MEGNQKLALTFAIYRGDQLVSRETVVQDIIKVGKDPKSHLQVADDAASRMHAVIEVQNECTLIDLGNEAGTTVNGARVNKQKLNAGDRIQIGQTVVVLEHIGPAEAVAAAIPAPPAAATPSVPVPAPAAAVPAPNPFAAAPANPFASPFGAFGATSGAVPNNAPEGSYEYQMLKNGVPVADHEVDGAAASIVVRTYWGRNLLNVDHLTPPRAYYVGEPAGEKGATVDYIVPAEKLSGTSRLAIVAAGPAVVIPPGATGTVDVAGQPSMTIQEAISKGMTQPSSEMAGAQQIPLQNGTSVRVEVNDLAFEVAAVNSGKKVAAAFTMAALAGGALLYVIGSFLGHVGVLWAMAMFMPPLGDTSDDSISDEQRYLIKQYLDSAAEKEMEEKETEEVTDSEDADNKEGGTGTRAKGEEGSMGDQNSKDSGKRYGVQGPADNADPRIARQAALRDAAEFGMIGLLNSGAGGDPDAPTAPWGADDSLGNDPLSARGNMWGDSIGDSFGAGGLGLSGIGEGGGGRGEGIGLGNVGGLGHGAGTGTGQGFGSGNGRLGRAHRARPPRVRMGATSVSGRLPPEVIQRIVRQNFGRFRLCYENALRTNPNLEGRVTVNFVIGRDGRVSNVGAGGLGSVGSCVGRAFYGLSFPQPEGGIVTVSYPILFQPGG